MTGKQHPRRKPRARWSGAERRRVFLETYGRTGALTISADAAGISMKTLNGWMRKERDFRKAFEEATLRFHERLDAEMMRRIEAGKDGVMLRFKLQAELPEKYGRAGKNVTVKRGLTFDDLERMAEKARRREAGEDGGRRPGRPGRERRASGRDTDIRGPAAAAAPWRAVVANAVGARSGLPSSSWPP